MFESDPPVEISSLMIFPLPRRTRTRAVCHNRCPLITVLIRKELLAY